MSLADLLATTAIPHACKSDFQQEAGGCAAVKPGLLRAAPASSRDVLGTPFSHWAAREFRLLSTRQDWVPVPEF